MNMTRDSKMGFPCGRITWTSQAVRVAGIGCLALFAAAVFGGSAAFAADCRVAVDFTKPAGRIKNLHSVNNAPCRLQKGAKVWEFETWLVDDAHKGLAPEKASFGTSFTLAPRSVESISVSPPCV